MNAKSKAFQQQYLARIRGEGYESPGHFAYQTESQRDNPHECSGFIRTHVMYLLIDTLKRHPRTDVSLSLVLIRVQRATSS
jgi:hypothetical protein